MFDPPDRLLLTLKKSFDAILFEIMYLLKKKD